MSDEWESLLRFEKSGWPVFSDRLSNAADALRSAIAARDWTTALAESRALGGVAADVVGIARSMGPDDARPGAAELEAFVLLNEDPLLNLALPAKRWDDVVRGYAFLRLGVGWTIPRDLVAGAICGDDLAWPALLAERESPGSHPGMRMIEDPFGTSPWHQVEKRPWPVTRSREAEVVRSLSDEARSVVTMLGGLTGRSIHELRMIAHTMKLSEGRLIAALRELEQIGFAEYPARLRSLAADLPGASLKSIAAEAGVRQNGRKLDVVDRLLDAGVIAPLAEEINRRRLYCPVALGPGTEALEPERAVATLWTALWDETRTPVLAPWQHDLTEQSAKPSSLPPKGAVWSIDVPRGVAKHLVFGDLLIVMSHDAAVTAVRDDGSVMWWLDGGDAPAMYSNGFLQAPLGVIAVASKKLVLIDPATGEVTWSWQPPSGEIVQQPAVHGDAAYIVTDEGLFAIKLGGDLLWEFKRKRLGAPALDGDVVVVTRAGEMLNALDERTGELLYRRRMNDLPRTWTPLACEGLIFVSDTFRSGRRTAALDIRTGILAWSHTSRDGDEPPVAPMPPEVARAARRSASLTGISRGARSIRESILSFVERDHERDRDYPLPGVLRDRKPEFEFVARLGELDVIADQSRLWGIRQVVPAFSEPVSHAPPEPPFAVVWRAGFDGHSPDYSWTIPPIAIDLQNVVVAAGSAVVALDRRTGVERWTSPTVADSIYSTGLTCLGVYMEHLRAIDPADGATLWEREFDHAIAGITHDSVGAYLVLRDGSAVCIDSSGRTRWEVNRAPEDRFIDEHGVGSELYCQRVAEYFAWSDLDGMTRVVRAQDGTVRVGPVDGIALGPRVRDRPLDQTNREKWWRERSFDEGRLRVLTAKFPWSAKHTAALVVARTADDEVLLDLPTGFDYSRTAVATDGRVIAVLAAHQVDAMSATAPEDADEEDFDAEWWDEERQINGEPGAVAPISALAVENGHDEVGQASRIMAQDASSGQSLPSLSVWLIGQAPE